MQLILLFCDGAYERRCSSAEAAGEEPIKPLRMVHNLTSYCVYSPCMSAADRCIYIRGDNKGVDTTSDCLFAKCKVQTGTCIPNTLIMHP